MSREVPIWSELGKYSSKKLNKKVGEHQLNLERFETSTRDSIQKLSKLEREIKRVEKRIVSALEKSNTAEAISDILLIRVLRIEEMVELSALSILRTNRFYNKLYTDIARGIEAGVKYDEASIQSMVPENLKSVVSTAIAASDFYDILSKYKSNLSHYINDTEEGEQ